MQRCAQTFACMAIAAMGAVGCSTVSSHNIDPRADAALQRMSQTLAQAQSFKLHSTATIEERLDSGQMAQFSRDSSVVMRRPDGFHATVRRGPDTHVVWHNGSELTILDSRRNLYATLQTPQRVDDMLDELAEKHGIVVPLDDLFFPDPYKVLTEHITSGTFVDQQDINGHKCDHLLFTQDNVDWQIWIDTGTPAVPRKVVITHKDDPDQPQFEAVLDDWQLNVPTDSAQFKPKVPQSARLVKIEELLPGE